MLHIIKYNELIVNILQGATSAKLAVGRPRLKYIKKVTRNTGADSYRAVKKMTCNNSRWKVAIQSKD
jgi:hypothetical protein